MVRLRLVQDPPSSSELAAGVGGSDADRALHGPSDSQLVGLASSGHRAAFESLYRRHVGFAVNLAVRLQGSAHDVEDLVHDAFMRAHGQLTNLKDPGAFRSWLGSIVVRLVRNRLRRERWVRAMGWVGRIQGTDLESLAAPGADPETRAQLAQAYALLATMPPDCRIAWTLRYVERHRLEDVASLTECSLATAKRRIAKAQRFLQQHFVGDAEVVPGADEPVPDVLTGGTR